VAKHVRTIRPPPPAQRSPPAGRRPKNKLLASLPERDFKRIRPHLQTVRVKAKEVLLKQNEPVRRVFFLNGGVASITAVMKDGTMVEIATVGDEGMLGVSALLGDDHMTGEAMIQVPDTDAEVMPIAAFRTEMDRPGAFQDCVRRYSQGLLSMMMQSTACMALHPVHSRCCRWLLTAHDRVHRDEFGLSHEFLAMMLGATRPTVTVVAGTLQKMGFIRYKHGHVTILDRRRLEAAACECYATVKQHFDRLGL
jgi:CRP-like cAMP-binding protein